MATEFETSAGPEAGQPESRTRSVRRAFLVIFCSCLAMIAATGVAASFVVHSWEQTLRTEIERNLTQKARMFAADVNSDRSRNIATLTSQEGQLAGARTTVVDMNGKVIADSEARTAALDGEGHMPEFSAALRGETGISIRSSSMFGVSVLYVAVPVSGGAVRLAYPLADVDIAVEHATLLLAIAGASAVIVALIISAIGSRRISSTT